LSLAVTFARNVFVPADSSINWAGFVIAIAAAVALFRFKRTILEVVGAGAALGLVTGLVATFIA
jgi:chromate transporter